MSKRTYLSKLRGLAYENNTGEKGKLPAHRLQLVTNPDNPEQKALVAHGQIINWKKYAKRTKRRHLK